MSKVSVKGQTTIPSSVREALGLKPGDLIQYVIEDGRVVLQKFSLDDVMYLKSMERHLNEWSSNEDDDLI